MFYIKKIIDPVKYVTQVVDSKTELKSAINCLKGHIKSDPSTKYIISNYD